MKIFVFADLHASERQLYNFAQFFQSNHGIDLIIFAGDAVDMGEPVGFMNNFIKMIEKIGLPFFWVPGNNDFGRAYHKLNAKYPSLEGRIVVIPASDSSPLRGEVRWGEINIESAPPLTPPPTPSNSPSGRGRTARRGGGTIRLTGVGGSPASWSGQYAGEKMIDKKSIAGSIFVSHTPPPGILVMNKYDWQNPNNVVISTPPEVRAEKSNKGSGRRFADAPLVHICGHQHSRWGCGYLGQTKVINPGPLESGRYVIMDTETLEVEFGRFDYGNSYRV